MQFKLDLQLNLLSNNMSKGNAEDKPVKKFYSLGGFRISNIRNMLDLQFPEFCLDHRTNYKEKRFDFYMLKSKVVNGKVVNLDLEQVERFKRDHTGTFFILIPTEFADAFKKGEY